MTEIKAMNIKIKVKTESKREEVKKKTEDSFEISLREPAEENRANDRIMEIMRSLYPNKPIRIIKGHHSPNKILSIGD